MPMITLSTWVARIRRDKSRAVDLQYTDRGDKSPF